MNIKPDIYIGNNIINTNQRVYYSKNNEKNNIRKKIDNIFKNTNIVYDKKIKIITNGVILEKIIIAKENDSLITDDHEIIPFDMINEIIEI